MRILIALMVALGVWLSGGAAIQAVEATHDASEGATLFEVHCVGCHINGGNIIRRGKNLRQRALQRHGYDTVDAIAQLVAQGKGNMSAYADRMTPDEIERVAEYVLEQAANNWQS